MPLQKTKELTIADRVARVWSTNFSLQIDQEEAAFLVGIDTWLETTLEPTMDEDKLREIYHIISELSHGDPSTFAARSTKAIARLREQHIIVRVDTAGIIQSGEFTLTQLGKALVGWISEQEGLTRQSLVVMMTRIRADLAEIKEAARRGGSDTHWLDNVEAPLRLTVSGIIEMIDQRQRGMDVQQEEIRNRVGSILEEKWFDAIQTCEELLETTSETLSELHRTLMHEVEGVSQLLNEIEDIAIQAERRTCEEAVRHVRNQMECITIWGDNRVRSWSEYFQNVHDFIRSVVRVDRQREISRRLREAIKSYPSLQWSIMITSPALYRHLREPETYQDTIQVRRKRTEHDMTLTMEQFDKTSLEKIEEEALLQLETKEKVNLVEILQAVFDNLSIDELYQLAGKLVQRMVEKGQPFPRRQFDWTVVKENIEVQDLIVYSKEKSPQATHGAE